MINPEIQIEHWNVILVVVISIIKDSPDEVVTVIALPRFQGVTVLFPLWKASQGP